MSLLSLDHCHLSLIDCNSLLTRLPSASLLSFWSIFNTAARVTLLLSDHDLPLLKMLRGLPLSLRVKSEVLQWPTWPSTLWPLLLGESPAISPTLLPSATHSSLLSLHHFPPQVLCICSSLFRVPSFQRLLLLSLTSFRCLFKCHFLATLFKIEIYPPALLILLQCFIYLLNI